MVILLDNALKYTQSCDVITVGSYTSKKHWYIEVKNTGNNISDTDKERILNAFTEIQLQEPAKRVAMVWD